MLKCLLKTILKIGIYMKFFKNKFFIAALSTAIFVTVFTVTLSVMGITDPVKDLVNTVSLPFRYAVGYVEDSIEGYLKYFTTIEKLDNENKELKDKISQLEGQLADSDSLKEENERLKEYLEIKENYPDFKFSEAIVIGSESENYSTVLTLNKGSDHGIEIGMPVIVKSGLVGSVCEVGSRWCRVRVITEASSSVGAYVSRSGVTGILEGDILLKDVGECYLRYISPDSDIEVGDPVYTSGIGSVYPEGLLIGRISSVEIEENLRTKSARVKLAVDFEDLKYLLIVTDFEKNSAD